MISAIGLFLSVIGCAVRWIASAQMVFFAATVGRECSCDTLAGSISAAFGKDNFLSFRRSCCLRFVGFHRSCGLLLVVVQHLLLAFECLSARLLFLLVETLGKVCCE